MPYDYQKESNKESKKESAMFLLALAESSDMGDDLKRKYRDAVLNLHQVNFIDMVMYTTFNISDKLYRH